MDEFNIPAGAYWPDEIDKGLQACDTVVGLLSPDSIASRNVKNEWDWALQNERPLLLVLVRRCTVPHRYVSLNWIDATHEDRDAALRSLADAAGAGTQEYERDAPPVPATRYARCGDNSVAYKVFGDGPVDLVMVPGFISHIEHEWTFAGWARLLRGMGEFARVIKFDKRGTGLSDRIGRVLTMEERVDDIRAVMDAAGSERAVILGVSEGGGLAALFAATHPERTLSLMIYGGLASNVARSDYPWPLTPEEYLRRTEDLSKTLHERWGTEQFAREFLALMAPSACEDSALIRWTATLLRLGASPGAEIARRRMNYELDVRGVLPKIRVPAVVLHRTGDLDVNVEEGRYIAGHIPGARFVELPGDDHFPFVGDQEPLLAAITGFLEETARAQQSQSPTTQKLATVLCLMVPLGRRPIDADGAAIDAALARFDGQVLTRDAHRITAAFDGSIRAMRCAQAISGALRAGGHEARTGLHSGEVGSSGDRDTSEALEIAVQLASLGGSGDIVVSSIVRSLSPGSGIAFEDLGEHRIRGVESPVAVLRIPTTSAA